MKRIPVLIDDETHETLRKLSFDTRLAIAEHIRKALNHYLTATYGANYNPGPRPEKEE